MAFFPHFLVKWGHMSDCHSAWTPVVLQPHAFSFLKVFPRSKICWNQWKSMLLSKDRQHFARIPLWEEGTRFLANSSLHPLSAEADDRIIFYQDADSTRNQHKRSVIRLWISSQDCLSLTLSIWYLNFKGALVSGFSWEAEILVFNSPAKFLLTSVELISCSG